jgi:four helix bundle protein
MRHENLRLRTFQYSVACIQAARVLLTDPLGRLLSHQLVRSGGPVGANYSSACHAKSRPDFASKIAVVAEEAAEAAYWFEIFVAIGVMTEAAARPLIVESRELAAIAIASARTARRRKVEGSSEM